MLADLINPLCDYTAKKTVALSKEDSVVGIEFENEIKLSKLDNAFLDEGLPAYLASWKFHAENSLRHYGFEWVSAPIPLHQYKGAVLDLFLHQKEVFKMPKLQFTNSIRTSVHVHFDVGRLNTLEITSFACLYWLLEPVLQHFCGAHRQGNLFCMRLRDSGYTKINLAQCLKGTRCIIEAASAQENFRYASVNLNSIIKFGTLEFRLMRGVSAPEDAFTWIDTLEAIRKYSLKFKHPKELRKWFLNDIAAADLLEEVIGKDLAEVYLSYMPEGLTKEGLVREGYLSVLPILLAAQEVTDEMARKEEEDMLKKHEALVKKYQEKEHLPTGVQASEEDDALLQQLLDGGEVPILDEEEELVWDADAGNVE